HSYRVVIQTFAVPTNTHHQRTPRPEPSVRRIRARALQRRDHHRSRNRRGIAAAILDAADGLPRPIPEVDVVLTRSRRTAERDPPEDEAKSPRRPLADRAGATTADALHSYPRDSGRAKTWSSKRSGRSSGGAGRRSANDLTPSGAIDTARDNIAAASG